MAPEAGGPATEPPSGPPPPAFPSLREKTKRGLLWASAEAVARTVLQTLILVVLSRLLTPDDYGVVGAALIIVGISAIFSQLGVGPAIVQRPDLEPRHLDTAFVLSVIFGLLTAGVIYGAAPLFALFFKMTALTPVLRALAVIFPLTSLSVVSESLLQRDLRFDLIARAEIVSYFLGGGVVAIALAWAGWGAWSLVAGQISQMAVRTAMLFGLHVWRPHPAFDRTAARDLRDFSGGVTIARLANYVASMGDNVVVGRYLGAASLGVYSRAYQLMSAPAVLGGNVLEKVLFPAMAKVQDQDARLAGIYRQGIRLLATLMLPGSAMIHILAPEIVRTMLGAKWEAVIFPLQVFSGALLFRTSMKLSNSLIRAKGAVFQMASCQLIYAASIVGLAYAGRVWGLEGVCIGVFASILLCFFIGAGMSLRLVGLTWLDFFADHRPGLLLTAVVAAPGWYSAAALRAHHAAPLLVLAGTLGVMLALGLLCAAALPAVFLGPDGPRFRAHARALLAKKRGAAASSRP